MTPPSIPSIISLIPEIGWANFTRKAAADKLEAPLDKIPEKKELLKLFHTHITQEFQKTFNAADLEDIPFWEAVMEVILCRLELLTPHKPALQRIYRDIKEDPCLLRESFSLDLLDNTWPLKSLPSRKGIVMEKMMGVLYGLTLRHWLNDSTSTLDNTMAFLDHTIQWIQKAMGMVGELE
jgi:hypothetical protein